MKFIQSIARVGVFLALLTIGVVLVVYPTSYLYEVCAEAVQNSVLTVVDKDVARTAVGVAVIVLSILAFAPLSGLFARKIRFSDDRGETVIDLRRIERALAKALRRLPEVRKLTVELIPSKDRRTVDVRVSNVVLAKTAETNTRDLAGALKRVILEQAQLALGPDEVAGINVTVKSVTLPKGKRNQPSLSALALEAQRRSEQPERRGFLPEPPLAATTAKPDAASAATPTPEPDYAGAAPAGETEGDVGTELVPESLDLDAAATPLADLEAASLPDLDATQTYTPEGVEATPVQAAPAAIESAEPASTLDDFVVALETDRDEAEDAAGRSVTAFSCTPSEEGGIQAADPPLRNWLDDEGEKAPGDAVAASTAFEFLTDVPAEAEESEAADPLRDDQPEWGAPKPGDEGRNA